MTTINVKPAPSLPAEAAKVIVHPASGGLLDASGNVPADGRPWLYDGFTCRMLTEGTILYADDPVYAAIAAEKARAKAEQEATDTKPTVAPATMPSVMPPAPDPVAPLPTSETDPAH